MSKGQGLVEYALILVLVAVVVIVFLTILTGAFKLDTRPIVERDRNAYWNEVVPPPHYQGKCYEYRTGAIQTSTSSVWCIPDSDM